MRERWRGPKERMGTQAHLVEASVLAAVVSAGQNPLPVDGEAALFWFGDVAIRGLLMPNERA